MCQGMIVQHSVNAAVFKSIVLMAGPGVCGLACKAADMNAVECWPAAQQNCLCLPNQALMTRTSSYEDLVRWARCLSEIMKQAGLLCKDSARAGYVEVSSRLQVRPLSDVLQVVLGKLFSGQRSPLRYTL